MQAPKHARVVFHCSILATAFLASAGHGGAAAQTADTLRIRDVIASTRANNPSLHSARLRADAASERVRPAGALANPMLTVGMMNRPLDDFAADQAMTMNSVQLSQSIPWPGKRATRARQSGLVADVERLGAVESEAELVARVKSVYYQAAAIDRSIQIMARTRVLLRNLQEVATTRYSVGAGIQQDVLQAHVAVARLTADIRASEAGRAAMTARLNALMGRESGAPRTVHDLPVPDSRVPALDTLVARAMRGSPALEGARTRVRAADAGIESAEQARRPDFTVTVGYAQRPRFDDFATLMLGVSLPVWGDSRNGPIRREMEAVRAGAASSERALADETVARLHELRASAVRSLELIDLYRSSVLPQARAAVESSLSAYQVGNVDYMTLVTNQMTVNEYEIELVRLTAEYHAAIAGIERYTSPTTGEGR